MPGPIDSDLVLRAASVGDLTSDETDTLTLPGGVHRSRQLAVNVLVPQSGGSGKTLKVTASFTDTGKRISVTHTENIDDATGYPFLLVLPLPITKAELLSVLLDVTGGSENFGAVESWVEIAEFANVPA